MDPICGLDTPRLAGRAIGGVAGYGSLGLCSGVDVMLLSGLETSLRLSFVGVEWALPTDLVFGTRGAVPEGTDDMRPGDDKPGRCSTAALEALETVGGRAKPS